MALMLQREVADRIVAPPGSKTYGRLSVLCQWRCRVRIALQAPPQAFTPPPKVSSAVVVFTPVADPLPAGGAAALEKVTAAAFGQRRKMLRSSLKSLFADVEGALAACSIRPQLRAEDLSIEEFCRLAAFHAASGSP
jgi:16S rRNA (adenine1518-N6/adenine1519-N6)-dimethyltransferase